MLVSHRHRFIYTKTLKTGGTSVESYFERYCMPEGDWQESHERREHVCPTGIVGQRGLGRGPEIRWWNHMPASQVRDQLGETLWSDYFKFCVVRNPFEKVASMFFFELRRQKRAVPGPDEVAAQFEQWVDSEKLPIDRNAYLIDGVPCMDRFVRYEQLGQDLGNVCEHLGLPWTPERLPRFKTGIRPAWASVAALYTDQARQQVANTYAYELDFFGYRFGENAMEAQP